jgi:hypothetical protein
MVHFLRLRWTPYIYEVVSIGVNKVTNGQLFESGRRHAIQQLGHRRRASKGDFFNNLALTHFLTDFNDIFLGGDNVDDAIWHSRTAGELWTAKVLLDVLCNSRGESRPQ